MCWKHALRVGRMCLKQITLLSNLSSAIVSNLSSLSCQDADVLWRLRIDHIRLTHSCLWLINNVQIVTVR